jgi:CRISPR-associated protein Csx16
MSVILVSRHAGAVEWAGQEGLTPDKIADHLEMSGVRAGDTIIGTLPIQIVARLNALGARYMHIVVDLPADRRGAELTSDEMRSLGARLVEFVVREA